jgi:hypothetical protein
MEPQQVSGHSYEIVLSQNQEATVPFLFEFHAEPQDIGLVVYIHHQGNVILVH